MCQCVICKTASDNMTKVWLEALGREVYICTDCAEDFATKFDHKPSGWQVAEMIKKYKKLKQETRLKKAAAAEADERLKARFASAMRFMNI